MMGDSTLSNKTKYPKSKIKYSAAEKAIILSALTNI